MYHGRLALPPLGRADALGGGRGRRRQALEGVIGRRAGQGSHLGTVRTNGAADGILAVLVVLVLRRNLDGGGQGVVREGRGRRVIRHDRIRAASGRRHAAAATRAGEGGLA